jgi:hypothetical protein
LILSTLATMVTVTKKLQGRLGSSSAPCRVSWHDSPGAASPLLRRRGRGEANVACARAPDRRPKLVRSSHRPVPPTRRNDPSKWQAAKCARQSRSPSSRPPLNSSETWRTPTSSPIHLAASYGERLLTGALPMIFPFRSGIRQRSRSSIAVCPTTAPCCTRCIQPSSAVTSPPASCPTWLLWRHTHKPAWRCHLDAH